MFVAVEPSRRRLQSLQAVLKMLVQSPNITQDVNANWVKKSGFKDNDFTSEECQTVAFLTNKLRPYIPKKQPEKNNNEEDPTAHITLRAPIVLIADTLLRITGYHEFCRSICPQHSAGSLHPLPLTSTNIYEMFCSKRENQFDVFDSNSTIISNVRDATAPNNKRSVFGGFFNLGAVDQICEDHNLRFANR